MGTGARHNARQDAQHGHHEPHALHDSGESGCLLRGGCRGRPFASLKPGTPCDRACTSAASHASAWLSLEQTHPRVHVARWTVMRSPVAGAGRAFGISRRPAS